MADYRDTPIELRALDRGGGVHNVRAYGAVGDGVSDDTQAIQAAIDEASAAGGGVVLCPPGTYLVSVPASGHNALEVTASNITLAGHHATITCPDPEKRMMLFEDLVRFHGAGREAAPRATLAADGVERAGRLTLSTAAHGLVAGDIIHIASDGEVFSGVPGESGFELVLKGELLEVRAVEGAEILLRGRTADSYDATTHTVSVYRCSLIERVAVEGIRFVGAGRRNVVGMSQGQTGARFEWCRGMTIRGSTFEALQGHAIALRTGMDARVHGCTMLGDPDIGYGPDHSMVSPYLGFYGLHAFGVQGGTITQCYGRFLRRLSDMGSTSQMPIPGRNWVMSSNVADFCWQQAIGAHTGESVVIANNVVRGSHSGIGCRSKRAKIIGNLVEGTYPQTDSGTGISVGISADLAGNEAAWEKVHFGDCEIIGNTVRGFGRPIRWSSVAGQHVKVEGNTVETASPNTFNHGIQVTSPSLETLEVRGNVVDCTSMGDHASRGYGIELVQWPTMNGRLRTLRVEDNTIISPGRSGMRLFGIADPNARADMVWMIRDNIIRFDKARDILPFAHVELAGGGSFGRVVIADNDFRGAIRHTRAVSMPDDRTLFFEAAVVSDNSQDSGLGIGTGNRRRLVIDEYAETAGPITIQAGDRISQGLSTGGGYERLVQSGGTVGALAGVTGAINAASNALTVNTVSGVFVGAILRIAGAGAGAGNLDSRVLHIDGLQVTLADAAQTTVAGAAVTYRPPTFRQLGIIGAAQAAAHTNSSATDVAALRADLNGLLAKLRAANLIGS